MEQETRCRLLELPAELRMRIYELALAPTGTVCLTSTKSKRFATNPVLAPGLLGTCRQIYKEAVDILYAQNTVCISVDAHDTSWPTISEKRLPQDVLERLQHLFVVLDITGYVGANYNDVDWTAFSALVTLKTLRLSIITQDSHQILRYDTLEQTVQALLPHILQRVPEQTSISYGSQQDSEEQILIEKSIEVALERLRRLTGCTVKEMNSEEVSKIAESLDVQQGIRCGGIEDVFAEYHVGSKKRNRVQIRSF